MLPTRAPTIPRRPLRTHGSPATNHHPRRTRKPATSRHPRPIRKPARSNDNQWRPSTCQGAACSLQLVLYSLFSTECSQPERKAPMPDDNSTASMPIPLGVLETGGFAGGIDSATIQQLKPQDVYGTVPKDIVAAKGESDDAHFGLVGGEMDANDLKIAGWAVMFGATVDQKIKTNLSPLIEHRRQQVG